MPFPSLILFSISFTALFMSFDNVLTSLPASLILITASSNDFANELSFIIFPIDPSPFLILLTIEFTSLLMLYKLFVTNRMFAADFFKLSGSDLSFNKAHKASLLFNLLLVNFKFFAITAMSLFVLLSVRNISSVSIGFLVGKISFSSASGESDFDAAMFTTLFPTNPSVPIETIAFFLKMNFALLSIIIFTSIRVSFIILTFSTVPISIPAYLTLFPDFKPCTFSNLALNL